MTDGEMLINGDGEFNESALDGGGGASIAVVAIMGPQSSGKSTLLNQLFGTNFEIMNAQIGRAQTTKGIWIAKASHMEPVTVVLDLEGTDGKERGEDDKTFEKQSALFALAVAETVLINMWCNEIGRENAANRPLLKTIFQAMLSFLSPQKTSPQKTTLIFVVRDKTKTPLKQLELELNKDVHKIWEAVPKPKGHEHTAFTQIFDVKVTVLSNYDFMRADFDQEVDKLKQEIVSSHKKWDNNNYRPTLSIFLSSAKKTWDVIKENKDLQVPPYRVMVATMRCQEIVSDKLRLLQSNQAWLELQQNAKIHLVKDFGKTTSLILDASLSKYDEESLNLEENVTKLKRQFLMSEALKVVHHAYMHTLGHIRAKALQSFKTQLEKSGIHFSESAVRECHYSCVLQFNQQCSDYAAIEQASWEGDVSTVRQELLREIKEHALYQLREQLSTSLTTQMEMSKVREHPNDVWGCIRSVIKSESERAKSAAVDIFGVENEEVGRIVADLKRHAANRVKTYFEDKSRHVLTLMNERFVIALMDSKSLTVKEKAYRQCLDILSTMAVIRLDNNYDVVRGLLYSGFVDGDKISTDIYLSSTTWEEVPLQNTLITPIGCKDIWDKFRLDMELHLANDKLYREKQRKKKEEGWSLPTWAIVGLLSLGSAALVALAICHPPAATPLITFAITLATTAGIIFLDGQKYRCSDTNEIIEKDKVLENYPRVRAILENNLNRLYESLLPSGQVKIAT